MRVLLDCRAAERPGVSRYVNGLVRALVARGDIEVIQAVSPGGTPPAPGAPTVTVAGGPLGIRSALALGTAVRSVRPDLTHCLQYPTPMPARHPLVVTIHDLGPIFVEGVMPSATKRAAYAMWNRRVAWEADRIVCDSAWTASDLRRFAPIAAERIRVVQLAADDFSAGPVGGLPEWLLDSGAAAGSRPRFILSMGGPEPHKDLPALLRVFSRLAEGDPELLLVLVGGEQPELVFGALEPGDPALARVRFSGHVEDPELRALYASAAVFAFPSRYEGFALPPLEAMSMGAPVVCSDAAALPEVVGTAAALVPPGDDAAMAAAIRRVLDDPAERERLVAAGRARASRLSWAATAEATVRVYREALDRPV
jgi:glycosyltransferase involved in cell wall biosynthesis